MHYTTTISVFILPSHFPRPASVLSPHRADAATPRVGPKEAPVAHSTERHRSQPARATTRKNTVKIRKIN